MARGNGLVNPGKQTGLRLQPEMEYVVKLYQQRYRHATVSAALRRIVETHPDIIAIVEELMYTAPKT
jgi:hypothetical protein